MATLSELTETGASGSNGTHVTTGNSIFDTITGAANSTQPTFSNTTHTASLSISYVTAAQDILTRANLTAAKALVWEDFFIRVDTLPGATTAVHTFYNSTTKIGDVRVIPVTSTTFQLQIRNGSSNAWTSAAIATSAWHRVAIKINPGTPATGLRMKLYSDANLDTDTVSQDSGDCTYSQAPTTCDNVRWGVISSDTMTMYVANIRADDASQILMGTGGGGGGGTSITKWTEGFEGASAGTTLSTSNCFMSSSSGAATATFFADPYAGVNSCRVNPTAQDVNYRVDLTSPVATVWHKFRIKNVTNPAASKVIMNWNSGTTNTACELRIVPNGGTDYQLQIRNGASTQVAISTALALNTYHEVAVWVDPTNAQARLRIYSGANRGQTSTTTYDSTLLTCTPAGGITSLNLYRFGLLAADTCDYRVDGLVADTTTEPPGISPPGGSVTETLTCDISASAEPYTTGTLTALGAGGTAPYTYAFSQTAGTTAALSGSGATRTFTVPAVQNGDTLTFHVVATDNVSNSGPGANVNVTVLDQNHYYRHSGTLTPFDWKSRHGGNLV